MVSYLVSKLGYRKAHKINHLTGPLKQKQDLCTFLKPIVQSFKLLQQGIELYDQYSQEFFIYRAHITHVVGDTPAISKMMGIKGVNSEFPCRNCRIQSQKGPSNTYYRSLHPPNQNSSHTQTYNPLRLPIWNSEYFKNVAVAVDEGRSWLSHHTGIKQRSPLLELSSIKPPWCFCLDTMHLILENVVTSIWKHLLGCQSPEFNDPFKHGNDILSKSVLDQIESEIQVGQNNINVIFI